MVGIDEGYYRIRIASTLMKTQSKTRVSYLRVTFKDRKKYFQIDNGIPFLVDEEEERFQLNRFEILGKIEGMINYHHAKITVRFQDNLGYEVVMEVSNLPAFNKILEQFPRLKKELSMSK